MTTYLVPAGYGEAEYIDRRSRFIARVWYVQSQSEAVARIEETRKKHYDATHNVYAYILRDNGTMRYSDDGEPSGTSGQPALNVFRSEGIQDVCCVVTRYFGGILLGAGGLVHAYSSAAKLALDAAGVSRMALWISLAIPCSYAMYERIRNLLCQHEAIIENTDFGADVVFEALVREDRLDGFSAGLTELTCGSVTPLEQGSSFRGVRIR